MKAGDRVELHPCTDEWMSGDRFGEVKIVMFYEVCVKLDKSQREIYIKRDLVTKVS